MIENLCMLSYGQKYSRLTWCSGRDRLYEYADPATPATDPADSPPAPGL